MSTQKITTLLGVGFFLISIIIFVNPIGDFPLNDDWQYAYPVKSLIEKGSYTLTNEFSPNIFLQVIWGYLFCLIPNEFSFTYLRISTLVAAFIGAFVFFKILKTQLKRSFKESLLLTLFLVFNPLFFVLSFSFMTDVPFLTLCLASVYFYKKYLDEGKIQSRILGGLFSIIALFLRQPGILVLLAAEFSFLIFAFFENRKKGKSKFEWKPVFLFLGSVLISVVVYSFIEKFLKPYLEVTENYISVGGEYLNTLLEKPHVFIFQLTKRSLVSVFYLGLFFLPMGKYFLDKIRGEQFYNKQVFGGVVIFNLLLIYGLHHFGYVFPFGGNVIYNMGLGPVLFSDIYDLDLALNIGLPNWIVMSFGLICQVLGTYILFYFIKRTILAIQNPLEHKFFILLLSINIIYLSTMMVFSYFARYLLLLFSSVLILFFEEKTEKKIYQYKSFIILSILMVWFSVAGTKDYLAWNRLAKTKFEQLKNQGIEPRHIDAGLPINGFEETIKNIKETHKYMISLNILEGYEVVEANAFHWWLTGLDDEIYILRKKTKSYQN